MGKVILHFSMSLDGFIAGPNVSVESPMGEGGLRLHDWLLSKPQDDIDAYIARGIAQAIGAVVLGKRTFDVGIGAWQDVPYPVPSFVLTHQPRAALAQKSGSFVFVNGGVESALSKAKVAAGDRDIVVMGADVAQQCLKAGLVDELVLQIVPVLMKRGVRLFEHLDTGDTELELIRQAQSPQVTHLRYRILK